MLKEVLQSILIVIALLLIVLVLLQSGKSEGITFAFSGGSDLMLFQNVKERGFEKTLSRITLLLGLSLILCAICIQIF